MKFTCYVDKYQREFLQSKARYRGFFCGRRFGKSYAFAYDIVISCLSKPNQNVLYLTTTNALCLETFERIAYHPAIQPLIKSAYRKKGDIEITFKNGSKVIFRCWAKIHLVGRGFKYHHVYIDEIQNFPEEYFTVIKPTTKDTGGRITVAGQHISKLTWYYQLFYLRGQSPYALDGLMNVKKDKDGNPIPQSDYQSWQLPSSKGLMFQGKAGQKELEDEKEVCTDIVYAREYDCEPTGSMYAAFYSDNINKCILTLNDLEKQALEVPNKDYDYLEAVDIARSVDFCCITVTEIQTGRVVKAVQLPHHMNFETCAQRAAEIQRQYGASVILDRTGLEGAAGGKSRFNNPVLPIFERQLQYPEPFTFGMHNKAATVVLLNMFFKQNKLKIPEHFKEMLKQLFEYESKNGKYGAPKGRERHDDFVSCLLMTAYAIHNNRYKKKGTGSGYRFSGIN